MDPVTHGLIGATASQSISPKHHLRYASAAGMLAAMLADLDIFISDPSDPLLQLEIHRQFTHSLIFIPVGALIAACLLWWFMRKQLSFKQLYLYSFVGYATSGIADTFTSYGTKLFWPFLDDRFSWNIISVFDPLFSAGILIGVAFAFYHQKRKPAHYAICWLLFYLLLGTLQQYRGQTIAKRIASQRNHQIEQLVVKPTIANTLLWSIRYEANDTLYADGIQLVPFTNPIIYEGDAAPILNWQQQYKSYQGSTLYDDIQRFNTLSEGYLINHPKHPNVIGDGRYALLPTRMNPLWGIKIDTISANQHVSFQSFRDPTPQVRSLFLKMVLGQPIEKQDLNR